jgi:hypothetical protein
MDLKQQKKNIFKRIKEKCLIQPIYIDVTHNVYRDDELELKFIKKNNSTHYELSVYDFDSYESVFYGKYYKQELMDSMLKVFTEETEKYDELYLYLWYDSKKQTYVFDDIR